MASQQHRSSVVVLGLIVLLLVLTIIAAVIAAILVFSDRTQLAASPWLSPLSTFKASLISPALALNSLADVPDETIVAQAVAAGKVDTAFATLVYSTSLSDQMRAAGLLTLASRLVQDGKKDTSAVAARTAADIVILSPAMPDYSRAALLAQAGQALASAGKGDEATHASNTAAIIAEHSGRIEPSYRQILLDGLANDAARTGRKDQALALRAASSADPPPADKAPYVLPSLLVPLLRNDSSVWAELDAATGERILAANALIAALGNGSPAAAEAARQTLEKALLNEDRLRDRVFGDGMVQSDNLLQRVAFARGRMEWLTLKWRVARQGFGLSLVPAWENQTRTIEANLGQACADQYSLLRDAAASLPGQIESLQGTIDVVQDQIKWGRLGLPPAAQEADLVYALDQATRDRMSLGIGYLSVTTKTQSSNSQLDVVNSR